MIVWKNVHITFGAVNNRDLLCLYQTLSSTGVDAHLKEKSQPQFKDYLKRFQEGKRKAAKKERRKSCPPPRGNVCFLPVPPCLQREHTGSLSCFPPFACLSTDLLRTNKRVEQLFHYPLTQGFSEPLFPRWVSSFCSLMHMAMVLRSPMMLEQCLLLLLSNNLFLLSSILQALNSITFTE